MKQYLFYDIGRHDWRGSPFVYNTLEETDDFYEDLHPGYYFCYRFVLLEDDEVIEDIPLEEFLRRIDKLPESY